MTAAALLEKSADELASTAQALSSSAVEMLAASKDLGGDAEALRVRAAGLQSEALRCLLAAMAARAVAERLSVISQLRVEAGGC